MRNSAMPRVGRKECERERERERERESHRGPMSSTRGERKSISQGVKGKKSQMKRIEKTKSEGEILSEGNCENGRVFGERRIRKKAALASAEIPRP